MVRITDEQSRLVALLPYELKESKELTLYSKILLGYIINWYNTNAAKNNGHCFFTNNRLKEETGIKTTSAITSSANLLIQYGLLQDRISGSRGKGTVYILSETTLKMIEDKNKRFVKDKKKGINQEKIKTLNEDPISEIKTLYEDPISNAQLAIIQALMSEIVSLKDAVKDLKSEIKTLNEDLKCRPLMKTPDIESDKEKENITEVIKEKEFTETQTPSEQSTLYIRNDFDNSEIEVTPKTNSFEVNSESDTDNHMTNNTNFSFEVQTEEEVTEVQSSEEVNNEETTDNEIDNNNEIQNNEEMTQTTMSNTDYQLTEEMELWKELMTENPNETPEKETSNAGEMKTKVAILKSQLEKTTDSREQLKMIRQQPMEVRQAYYATNPYNFTIEDKNKAFSQLIQKVEDYIRLIKGANNDLEYIRHTAAQIDKALTNLYERKAYFTQKQWALVEQKEDICHKFLNGKEKYFALKQSGTQTTAAAIDRLNAEQATGAQNTTAADKLSTAGGKTCQKAQECPITQSGEILTVEELDLTMTTDTYNTEKKAAAVEETEPTDTDNRSTRVKGVADEDIDTFNDCYCIITDALTQLSVIGDINDGLRRKTDKAFDVLTECRERLNDKHRLLIDKAMKVYREYNKPDRYKMWSDLAAKVDK